MTLACFALGGLIYGPFTPMTCALFQSATGSASLPTVLAARGAIIMVSTRLGTAAGGSLAGALGAAQTLTASGAATVLLAVTMGIAWRPGCRFRRRLAAEKVRQDGKTSKRMRWDALDHGRPSRPARHVDFAPCRSS